MRVVHEAQHKRWLFYPKDVRICVGIIYERDNGEFTGMRIKPTGKEMFSFPTWDKAAAYVKAPHEKVDV